MAAFAFIEDFGALFGVTDRLHIMVCPHGRA
jgi:hypothetical protein